MEFWRLLWLLILRKNLKNFICLRINQRWATGNVDLDRWDMSFKEHCTIIATETNFIMEK